MNNNKTNSQSFSRKELVENFSNLSEKSLDNEKIDTAKAKVERFCESWVVCPPELLCELASVSSAQRKAAPTLCASDGQRVRTMKSEIER